MTQQTLTDALSNSEYVSVSEEQLQKRYTQFQSLAVPTHDDVRFDANGWREFITNCSQYEAEHLRNAYDWTERQETILAGVEFYHGKTNAFSDAFTLCYENEDGDREWLDEKVKQFVQEFGQRFVFAPLIASWVPTIYICDGESYYDRVESSSSGYYHPTEHWIAVKFDSGDPDTKYWSVSRDEVRRYESSTTIHELGHAVHYLFSAQTVGSESVDNSDKTSKNASLSYKSKERTEWQSEFCNLARDGYFDLLDDEVDAIGLWKQEATVEEYLAEGFCAYLTAPRWIAQEQPQLYQAFNLPCS